MVNPKPRCPKCNCETITQTIGRAIVYKINSIGFEEFEGEDVLVAVDVDMIDADETDKTVYTCTDCEFESDDLTDFAYRDAMRCLKCGWQLSFEAKIGGHTITFSNKDIDAEDPEHSLAEESIEIDAVICGSCRHEGPFNEFYVPETREE